MRKIITMLVYSVALALNAAWAQETSGLVGTVTDQSGAVVAGAEITVTNLGTGLTRTVKTASTGDYAAPSLPVGTYKITAEMAGFKLGVASDVKLDVQHAARVDFSLQVGEVTQQVNITSVAPLLQTHDSQVGSLIENRRILDLPLNGRNFTQLNLLVPGVVEGSPGDYVETYSLGPRNSGVSFSVDGQNANYNEYLLDGVPIKEVQHEGPAISPTVDAIEEFRVQTSNYDAQLGSEAGGQINLVTKSGTNRFHGSAYDFVRNDKFDARNFFANRLPELRRNQFGGTMGGPIRKDNTFAFGSYEGTRIRKGYTQLGLVPGAAERSGDFSDLLPQGIQIIDPLTGQPFDGNRIPQGRLSSYATQLLQKYVPLPDNPANPVLNWISTDPNKVGVDQGLGRIDHRFSQNDVLYGRFVVEDVGNVSPKLFPTDSFVQESRGLNIALSETHTFASNKVNEFKMAYNRHRQREVVGRAFTENVGNELGLQGICEAPACWGIPDNYVGPFLDFGEHGQGQTVSGPRSWENEMYYFDEAFYWTKGSHVIRFGMWVNRHRDTFPEAIFPRGLFGYDGRFTSPDGSPNSYTALADYLLGLPRSSLASIDIFDANLRNTELYPWFQDDWRITRSLTLNLGLSWYWFGRPQSKRDVISNIDFAANPIQLVTAKDHAQFGFPRSLMDNDNNNFAPRVGFAWAPERLKRLVVRGGYGMFYQRDAVNNFGDLAVNPPFVREMNYILEPSAVPTFNIDTIFTQAQPFPLVFYAMARARRDAYIQGWNLTAQYQPSTNTVITLGYVGNKDTKLPTWIAGYDVNEALPGPGSVQSRRPYSNFGTLNYFDDSLASNYHSLQAEVRRQFSNGLSLLGAYTWSKCLDNEGFQDPRYRNLKGLSGIDARQRFVLSYIYELPFGPGKPFASRVSGPTKQLIAGWQVNGITTFASGQPATAYMPGDWANVGGSAYPDLIANPNLSGSQRTPTHYFNTAAFIAPPPGSFGTAGRNIIIGPGINNFDFAVMKMFPIREQTHLEFRAEFFNICNHANFIWLDTTFASPTFGVVTGARDPRDIQFGLKLVF
ncbi:MAG: carboxypeptidase-like regulatory domain-containing protein [Terriglobia bacterium]